MPKAKMKKVLDKKLLKILENYISDKKSQGCSEVALIMKKHYLLSFFSWYPIKLSEIRSCDVMNWLELYLLDDYSNRFYTLVDFFKYCLNQKLLDKSPLYNIFIISSAKSFKKTNHKKYRGINLEY